MTDNVTPLPEPGVVLNLDTLERPQKDVKPPFVIVLNERRIEFTDPAEIDWQDLVTVEIPQDLFRVALSKEDREFIIAQSVPSWKFAQLMETYYKHYDFEEKVQAAKRQARWS